MVKFERRIQRVLRRSVDVNLEPGTEFILRDEAEILLVFSVDRVDTAGRHPRGG